VPGLQIVAVGGDFQSNGSVQVYDALSQTLLVDFQPFGGGSPRPGARVAAGDVNGDCIPDLIVATGPAVTGQVTVYDGLDIRNGISPPSQLAGFRAFGKKFKKGVYAAVGDIDGDGFGDIIVSGGGPGAPKVAGFSGASNFTTRLFDPFNAFPKKKFRGGVTVAVGDYNGDFQLDVVAAAGPSGQPRVRVFDGFGLLSGFDNSDIIDDFLAFPEGNLRGLYVAAADTDSDGMAEIIVARNSAGLTQAQLFDTQIARLDVPPEVRIFDFLGQNFNGALRVPTLAFSAYGPNYDSGVRVGGWSDGDVNGDGFSDALILTSNGPDLPGLVQQFEQISAPIVDALFGNYAAADKGLFVGGSQRRYGLSIF
jgi:hypothetical protein